jgi:N-acetylmuramoyl-L-alanine amidase
LKKVVIDPGHGGKYDGCHGPGGALEKRLVLEIALKLRAILLGKGIKVLMTRQTDRHLSESWREDLERRVRICERQYPDVFISLHLDWCKKRSVRGVTVYFARDSGRDEVIDRLIVRGRFCKLMEGLDTEPHGERRRLLAQLLYERRQKWSRLLARTLCEKLSSRLGIPNRGVKQRNWHVVRWPPVPAVLVEIDYLSNPEAERLLVRDDYQRRVAEALAEGLLSYAALRAAAAAEGGGR